MQDLFNPYAAPTALEMHPKAQQWLDTPNESLRKVASGLGLIRTGVILLILTVVLFIVGIEVIHGNGLGPDAAQTLFLCFRVMLIVTAVLNLVGSIFCLSTPPESGARGWIFASVAAEVLSMVITVAELLGLYVENALLFQQLLGIIAFVTLIRFLRKVGLFIQRPDLARRAVDLLILWGVLIGLIVGSTALRDAAIGPEIGLAIAVVMLVLAIVALVKYLTLLSGTKSAILGGR
jgi:hypothetical protein